MVTFRLLMDIHAKKGLVDECLKIYYESQKYPDCKFDESLLSAALRACCNMRCIEEAEDLIAAAEAEGVVLPLACYNWLILGRNISYPASRPFSVLFALRDASPLKVGRCSSYLSLTCLSVKCFLNHV